jgi:hypothetical protein
MIIIVGASFMIELKDNIYNIVVYIFCTNIVWQGGILIAMSEFVQQFFKSKELSTKKNFQDFTPFYFTVHKFVNWLIKKKCATFLKKAKAHLLILSLSLFVCAVLIAVLAYTAVFHPIACVVMAIYFLTFYIFSFERRHISNSLSVRSNVAAFIVLVQTFIIVPIILLSVVFVCGIAKMG